LISSDTCHQNVVQNGFPSTSESAMPTASSATLLISSTVPCASSSPTNCTIESSVMRASFSRYCWRESVASISVP
jgi:hypothetical protein